MKRLLVLSLVALLGLGATACSSGDDAAVEVNGDVVLTIDELHDELDELSDADDVLTALDGRGEGSETLSSGFVSTVLGNHVLLPLIEGEVDDRGLEITQDDIDTGTQILTSTLGSSPSGIPVELEAIPAAYRQTLIDLYAAFTVLVVDEGGDPTNAADPANQQAQSAVADRLLALRQDADVEIAERYGSWDGESESPGVIPPEGPVSATTVPQLVTG